MPYTPQTWNNNDPTTPLSAARLTVMENGISYASGGVYNVKAYGAVGDGVTDDSAAIQSAINAAVNPLFSGIPGTIYFPYGKYYIGTGLTATLAGTTFIGEGMSGMSSSLAQGCTQLIVGDGIWGLTIGNPASTQYRGFRVENLHLYEKNAGKALGGILQNRTADSLYRNVSVGAFTNSVSTTFNGTPGALSTLNTLVLTSATGFPTSGTGRIATSGSATVRSFTYTGISTNTLTGVTWSSPTTDTVAGGATVWADVGIGLMLDGLTDNGSYNTFENCRFGTCTVGYLQRASNGTRMVACIHDGANNGSSVTTGSTGVLIQSGDTFRSIGGVYQGYDTLMNFTKSNNQHEVMSARWEIWKTAAVVLNGDTGTAPSRISGTGDNSLLNPGGDTGFVINTGVQSVWIQATLLSTATLVTDNGTNSTVQIDNQNNKVNYGPMGPTLPGTASNYLSADVTMTTSPTFYDGPTVTLSAGTWFLSGSAYLQASTTAIRQWNAKLWDGTTIISGATYEVDGTGQTGNATLAFSAIVTPSTSTTYKISASSTVNADLFRGTGTRASYLLAIRIA